MHEERNPTLPRRLIDTPRTPRRKLARQLVAHPVGNVQIVVKSLSAPDVMERFTTSSTYIVGTSEERADHIKKQITAWAKVIKAAGIRLD